MEGRPGFHRRPPERQPPPPQPRLAAPRLLEFRALAPLFTPPKALSREPPDDAGRLKEELGAGRVVGLGAGREVFCDALGRLTFGDAPSRLADGVPVEGLAPTVPVEGRVLAVPVEGRALTLPVLGAGRVAAAVLPDPHPRAWVVAARPGVPDLLSRLESGCHFCDGRWPRLMLTSPPMLTFRSMSMFTLLPPPR